MRKNPISIEGHRVTTGPMASESADGTNGMFIFPFKGIELCVVVSDGSGWDVATLGPVVWEHVSVSLVHRTPTWAEMDFVKDLFWGSDELVIQMHVPKSDHVNYHSYCLHLWKPVGVDLPRPPGICVGPPA